MNGMLRSILAVLMSAAVAVAVAVMLAAGTLRSGQSATARSLV